MLFGGGVLLVAGRLTGEGPRLVLALKHLPVTTASLYAYVNPVVAVLAASLPAAGCGKPTPARRK